MVQGDELTDAGNQLTDSGNELTGPGNELTDSGNELTGPGNELTDSGNQLTDSGNELIDSENELTDSEPCRTRWPGQPLNHHRSPALRPSDSPASFRPLIGVILTRKTWRLACKPLAPRLF